MRIKSYIKSQNCRPLSGIYVSEPHENPTPVPLSDDLVEKFQAVAPTHLKNLFDQVHVNVSNFLRARLAPASTARDEAAPPPSMAEELAVEGTGNFLNDVISLHGT